MEKPEFRMPGPKRRRVGGWFPTPAPREAARDLKSIFKHMDRSRWVFLALSLTITFGLLWGFLHDSDWRNLGLKPQLIYVESWPADRSDAEIQAQQARDSRLRAEVEAERQRQFQQLENKLGL